MAAPPAGADAVSEAEALAECADGAIQRIQTRYESIRDLEARFEQTTQTVRIGSSALGQPAPARGRVTFAKPGRMRWAYEEPARSLLVTDGEVLWLYDPEAGEAQRLPAAQGYLNAAAIQFLLGNGDLRAEFTIEAIGCEETAGVVELRLKPKRAASYETLGLRADAAEGEIQATTIVDLFGNETRISFSEIRENLDPPAETFTFEPPKGVEVIELEAPR